MHEHVHPAAMLPASVIGTNLASTVTCLSCHCSVIHHKGVQLVTDTVSYELLKGAVVDYTTDLIRASFEVRCAIYLSTKHLHFMYIPCSTQMALNSDLQLLLPQLLVNLVPFAGHAKSQCIW